MALICSIHPRRFYARARSRTALTGASIHGRLARKKSLCAIAIVSASLFHYDGVWRVPYPIRLAFSTLTALSSYFFFSLSVSLSSSLLPSSSLAFSSPSVFSFSFIRRPILVHVPLASFVRSTDGETRVHIFVTMMCVILRAGIREANTNRRERKRGKDRENKREERERGREKVRRRENVMKKREKEASDKEARKVEE